MTFESHELSAQDGSPFELFTFRLYGQNFRYTNEKTTQVVDGLTYEAWPIAHDEIKRTDKMEKQSITLDVPTDFPILQLYDDAPPSDVITLQIAQIHRGDNEPISFWNGRVMTGLRQGNRGQLYCENVYSSQKRQGLRRLYGRLCPHVLYGPACRAVDVDFRIEIQADSVFGPQLRSAILSTYPDGRFAGGLVEFEPTPGRIERRGVKSHVGDLITLTHAITDITALDTFFLYLGCKHDLTDCDETFGNAVNYGGWPYIPRISPMGSSSVF